MPRNNRRPQRNDPDYPEFEPRKGIMRLTDPDVAPSVRGVIVLTIIFKMITLEALKKGYNSLLLNWADSLATFGLVIALFMLGMLLWRKYGERWIKNRGNRQA